MKHIKTIALAVAVISSSAANATAGELKFNTPDISGKLNTMVEAKMDKLIKATTVHRGYTRIVELRPDGSVFSPVGMKTLIGYDVKANRS